LDFIQKVPHLTACTRSILGYLRYNLFMEQEVLRWQKMNKYSALFD